MKTSIIACLFAFSSVAFSYHTEAVHMNLDEEWSSFKEIYGRRFISHEDEMTRKEIFSSNLRRVKIHNMRYSRGLESFKMGINQFSDMTMEEFSSTRLTLRVPEDFKRNGSTFLSPLSISDFPTEIDWRTKGLVTPMKDQGQCGSCWAFSAIGSIEGQHARKTGTLVSLSEQNLIDCSGPFGNKGCGGGLMEFAFNYIIATGGIDTEDSYPYKAHEEDCKFTKESVGATISGFVEINYGDEKQLMEAVATVGPISVGIDASHDSFQGYKFGIYEERECSSRHLSHGVLVVGYGTENGKDYWLIKNSWGTFWGENGYMKMVRNKNNHCGIASLASYPTV